VTSSSTNAPTGQLPDPARLADEVDVLRDVSGFHVDVPVAVFRILPARSIVVRGQDDRRRCLPNHLLTHGRPHEVVVDRTFPFQLEGVIPGLISIQACLQFVNPGRRTREEDDERIRRPRRSGRLAFRPRRAGV